MWKIKNRQVIENIPMLLLYSGPLFSIFPPISFPPVPLLRSHLSLQLFFVIPSQLFIIFLTRLTLLLCFFLFLASPSLPSRLLLTFSSRSNYYPFSLLSSHKIFPFFSFCNLVYLAPFSTFVSSLLFFHFLSHLLPYFLFNSHICYQLHCSWFNKYVAVPTTTVTR